MIVNPNTKKSLHSLRYFGMSITAIEKAKIAKNEETIESSTSSETPVSSAFLSDLRWATSLTP